MELARLVQRLDDEFGRCGEDLASFAVTDDNLAFVAPGFIDVSSGLMMQGADSIEEVRTAVFVSESVVDSLCRTGGGPMLLFVHHPFDYFEDHRGVQPIAGDRLQRLLEHGHSLFSSHAGLDTHPRYGTSLALAELLGITVDERFFDYFGAPAAVAGRLSPTSFEQVAVTVQERLRRPRLKTVKHREQVEKVAVAAGGGDLPDLLQMASDMGCDTFVTGTVEHRWALPEIQENNRAFHQLNESLRLNLIGGTHFGTERPAMLKLLDFFEPLGIPATYIEDHQLLRAP